MQTVIVPVDFSDTSLNAARYAAQLLTGHYGVTMVLYSLCDKAAQMEETTQKLEQLKNELREIGIVKTETLAETGSDFITELEKLARHRLADLIIMGITGRSPIGQSLMGSNTLKMLGQKVCPLLIIPPDASYKDVKHVLLTSDFKNVQATTPTVPIKKILKTFHPQLHIMNADTQHYVALTEEYQEQKAWLQNAFNDFNPQFYFLGLGDVDDAISQFAHDKKIDLIIIIHKEQTIFSKLFVKSHTKKLVYQGALPVLALHE